MAPIFGKVFDSYGARGLLYFGTFMHVFGLMMMSLGKEYYQLFLAQSICSGIGASALFYASSNAATTWFFKRRALAVGIVASGSALGGLLLPIMFSRMIDDGVSFGWTVRTIAFLFLGLLAIACLSCKSRLNHTPKPFVPLEFVKPLADMRFLTLALGSFFFFWGIFLPTNYIILYAEAHGMSDSLANYQLAILNAMSIFGRIFSGWAADKYGRFNVMVLTITLSVVFVLGLWIPAHANASTIAFSAIYGFFSGSFVALLPTLVAQISDLRQIGVRVGTTFFIASFAGLTGNPIGGALLSKDGGGYRWLQVFCGVSMFVAGCFFLTTRLLQSTKVVAKV
ncbi:Major facilitator superfamily [Macrophomina phaseolina MS6]|uniref:Major facilitator superfamily n=2 Tax=Macrophomina phaseolina TaxID=35725 RepID=K2RJU0_MACPH|nr:Major facilitator superfamily [Macrophomina phaseolina MS6]